MTRPLHRVVTLKVKDILVRTCIVGRPVGLIRCQPAFTFKTFRRRNKVLTGHGHNPQAPPPSPPPPPSPLSAMATAAWYAYGGQPSLLHATKRLQAPKGNLARSRTIRAMITISPSSRGKPVTGTRTGAAERSKTDDESRPPICLSPQRFCEFVACSPSGRFNSGRSY